MGGQAGGRGRDRPDPAPCPEIPAPVHDRNHPRDHHAQAFGPRPPHPARPLFPRTDDRQHAAVPLDAPERRRHPDRLFLLLPAPAGLAGLQGLPVSRRRGRPGLCHQHLSQLHAVDHRFPGRLAGRRAGPACPDGLCRSPGHRHRPRHAEHGGQLDQRLQPGLRPPHPEGGLDPGGRHPRHGPGGGAARDQGPYPGQHRVPDPERRPDLKHDCELHPVRSDDPRPYPGGRLLQCGSAYGKGNPAEGGRRE